MRICIFSRSGSAALLLSREEEQQPVPEWGFSNRIDGPSALSPSRIRAPGLEPALPDRSTATAPSKSIQHASSFDRGASAENCPRISLIQERRTLHKP